MVELFWCILLCSFAMCVYAFQLTVLQQYLQLHELHPGWFSGKESTCPCRRRRKCGFDPWVSTIPWRRKWQPTPVLLLGKSHGQRSLVGYSSCGHKESDTTRHAHTAPQEHVLLPEECCSECVDLQIIFVLLGISVLFVFLQFPSLAAVRGLAWGLALEVE